MVYSTHSHYTQSLESKLLQSLFQFPLAVAISSGSSRQQQISSTGQSLANDQAMDIDSHISTSESIGSSGVTSSATRSHPLQSYTSFHQKKPLKLGNTTELISEILQ